MNNKTNMNVEKGELFSPVDLKERISRAIIAARPTVNEFEQALKQCNISFRPTSIAMALSKLRNKVFEDTERFAEVVALCTGVPTQALLDEFYGDFKVFVVFDSNGIAARYTTSKYGLWKAFRGENGLLNVQRLTKDEWRNVFTQD